MKHARLLTALAVLLVAPLAQAATHTVLMGNFFFSPATLSIAAGDTVVWSNATTTAHTSTSGSSCSADGLWNSGSVAAHATFSHTFAGTGSFPYFCSPHCSFGMVGSLTVTNAANSPPSVVLINPTNGVAFHAPATVVLQADATDSDGTVTNVQFYSGASLLGSITAAPFNFTNNNLPAGNYTFTATAFDNLGATATSPAVSIFVETNATLSGAVQSVSGQFQFTINGIAGQTYSIDVSTNLLSWTPLATNIAPADSFNFTDTVSTNFALRFYRTRQN